jgi:hypothetical protein
MRLTMLAFRKGDNVVAGFAQGRDLAAAGQ